MTLNSDLDESLRGWIAALERGDLGGRKEGLRELAGSTRSSHRVTWGACRLAFSAATPVAAYPASA
jgi:hypothetical protein